MDILKAIWTVYTIGCVVFTTFFLVGLVRSLRKAFSSKETDELVKQLHQQIKVVYVEQVCGVFHLYDKLNNTFIAQGYTEDEMWTNARLTFPKQEFILEGENGKAVLVSVKDKQ